MILLCGKCGKGFEPKTAFAGMPMCDPCWHNAERIGAVGHGSNAVADGDAKLLAVSQQIDDIKSGKSADLSCPYCTRVTAVGENFCCGTMMRAANALMDARDRFRPSLRS